MHRPDRRRRHRVIALLQRRRPRRRLLPTQRQSLTGADGNSIRLITTLDPVMPDGARVGQVLCRSEAGTKIETTHFTQFDDTCNHLHIDVGFTDGALTAN